MEFQAAAIVLANTVGQGPRVMFEARLRRGHLTKVYSTTAVEHGHGGSFGGPEQIPVHPSVVVCSTRKGHEALRNAELLQKRWACPGIKTAPQPAMVLSLQQQSQLNRGLKPQDGVVAPGSLEATWPQQVVSNPLGPSEAEPVCPSFSAAAAAHAHSVGCKQYTLWMAFVESGFMYMATLLTWQASIACCRAGSSIRQLHFSSTSRQSCARGEGSARARSVQHRRACLKFRGS